MKKGIIALGIIVGLIIAVVALYFASYVWIFPNLHNQTLKDFSQPLISIAVPAETELIDSLTEVGQQSGNSDHCDYLAAKLVKTNLSKSEVENYFRENYKGESDINFYWVNEPHKPGIGAVNPTNIYTLNDWVNIKSKETNANLIIYIFEGAMTSAFDYRCS